MADSGGTCTPSSPKLKENAETEQASASKATEEDPELEELLDSALEDFEKTTPRSKNKDAKTEDPRTDGPTGSGEGATAGLHHEEAFNQIFDSELAEQCQKHFEEAMKNLAVEDPNLADQMQKLASVAEQAGNSQDAEKEFAETLAQTLGSLAQNTQDLPAELSEADLLQGLSGLNLQDGSLGGEGDFMPMMQGMMKTLLSKEVLYPSLKEISEKYPAWLAENKPKLAKPEYDKYSEQYTLMGQICTEFEKDKDSDSEQVKQQRFELILDLMQKMQDCGQPPPDIVGEMAPGLEFDSQGNPKLPGSPEACAMM